MNVIPPGRIAVVDDEIEVLTTLRDFLEGLGYRVSGFSSGKDALKSLKEQEFDLLLTDLIMPETDGITVVKQALQIDPHLICIVVTGHGTVTTAVEAMKSGAFDYIMKPIDWKMLRPILLRAMEVRSLRKSEDHLRTLSKRLTEAEEHERQRIARELHDQVGQNLTALGIDLNMLRSLASPFMTNEIDSRLNDSMRLLEETAERIRDVMTDLRPSVIDDYGLMAAIRWYADQFSKRTNLNIQVKGEELIPRLPAEAEITLFRITQEVLTNVAKHARADNVTITLREDTGIALLTIADDGVGFDLPGISSPGGKSGWGLLNIRERAETFGGKLTMDSVPGKGTRIMIEIGR